MGNQTTVATTTIGGALAVVLVFLTGKFGMELNPTEAGMLVGAFTIIFNYFIPIGFLKRMKYKK